MVTEISPTKDTPPWWLLHPLVLLFSILFINHCGLVVVGHSVLGIPSSPPLELRLLGKLFGFQEMDQTMHYSWTSSWEEKLKAPLFVSSTKLVPKILIWLTFVSWDAFIFVYATEFGNKLFEQWIGLSKGTPVGLTGFNFHALN